MKGVGGEKRHRCELCGRGFEFKAYLNRHLSVHTGIKPFSCDICKKSFSLKWNLKKHLRVHEKDPSALVERPQQKSRPHAPPVPNSTNGEARLPAKETAIKQKPYSLHEIIGMALRNSPDMRCTVQEICQFVIDNFPEYPGGESKTSLENSIRANLSNMPHFVSAGFEYKFGENGINRQRCYAFRPVNEIIQQYEESCSIFI